MEQVGRVMMVDGGWGFCIMTQSAPAEASHVWIAFSSESEAVQARASISEVLLRAIWISVLQPRSESERMIAADLERSR